MELTVVADESVDFRLVIHLREIGVDVFSIHEQRPSVDDKEVLSIAFDRNALLITEDKDFGELVFRFRLPHKGILLIRVNHSQRFAEIANSIKHNYDRLHDKFSVIDDRSLRIKE
jgi:predicted nuclease of predicted toxin-antitoxin system